MTFAKLIEGAVCTLVDLRKSFRVCLCQVERIMFVSSQPVLVSQVLFLSSQACVLTGEHIKKCAVVHSTAYDGAIERACINLGVPVMSVTDTQVHYSYTLMTIANKLLEAEA